MSNRDVSSVKIHVGFVVPKDFNESFVLPFKKLNPSNNFLRIAVMKELGLLTGEYLVDCATAHYNSLLLSDGLYQSHLSFLYQISKEITNFSNASILLKIWTSIVCRCIGNLNGFLMSMIIAYLFKAKIISSSSSTWTIFLSALEFIGNEKSGLYCEQPICFPYGDGATKQLFTKEDFSKSPMPVFVDPLGLINLLFYCDINALLGAQNAANKIVHFLKINEPGIESNDFFWKLAFEQDDQPIEMSFDFFFYSKGYSQTLHICNSKIPNYYGVFWRLFI